MNHPTIEPPLSETDHVAQLTRWLAERTPRRSFFGKTGRSLVAASVGGTLALAVYPESADAANCGCCCDVSVSCGCLTGNNSCPSGTCECGCWSTCGPQCGHNTMYWCDCCNLNSDHYACISYCSNHPSNCFYKEWSGGCYTGHAIHCRHYTCSSSGPQPC